MTDDLARYELCWEPDEAATACDRMKGHKGHHSWEHEKLIVPHFVLCPGCSQMVDANLSGIMIRNRQDGSVVWFHTLNCYARAYADRLTELCKALEKWGIPGGAGPAYGRARELL